MSVELNTEVKVEESSKVEALDSKKVEFGGEGVKDLDSKTHQPDSYLESSGHYTTAEAIGSYLHKLAGDSTGAVHEVGKSYAEQLDKRLDKAMAEPRFQESVTDKAATQELEKQLAETKATIAELKAEIAHLKEAQTTPTINEMEHHVVVSGESLSKIALQEYGNPSAWPKIYEANKDIIGNNPAMIRVGQNLIIPPLNGDTVFNNIIVPDKPHETPPPVTPPDGGTGHAVESSPEMLEKVAKLEQKIETLTKDPQGITERNVTNDPNIDGQRIALKNQLEDLDRDLLKNRITPESYNDYTARYNSLHEQYNRVSIGLYKNHVDAVPLQFADKSTLDRLQYNETILSRALERGASADEVERLVDNSWRDYDDAKMGRNTNHHMAGGFVPNPEEGKAIANSIPDKHEPLPDKLPA